LAGTVAIRIRAEVHSHILLENDRAALLAHCQTGHGNVSGHWLGSCGPGPPTRGPDLDEPCRIDPVDPRPRSRVDDVHDLPLVAVVRSGLITPGQVLVHEYEDAHPASPDRLELRAECRRSRDGSTFGQLIGPLAVNE
jgi:hypothetical protein